MKSFFCSRVSKFKVLTALWVLGVTTISLPVMAAEKEVCTKTPTGDVVCGEPVPAPVAAPTDSFLAVLKGTHSFDGRTTYIQIANQPFLNFGTGNFSVSAWVKTASRNGIEVILDKRVETSGPVQGYVVATYNGNLLLQLADGTYTNYISSIFITDDQWHHIAITVDRQKSDGIRFYLDGNEASQPANPTGKRGSLSTSKPFVIGRRSDHPTWPGYFTGSMADIKLFRSSLTPQQIKKLATEKRG